MSTPQERAAKLHAVQLRAFGEDIEYTPAGGAPIAAKGIWLRPAMDQAVTYFGSIAVDPAVIASPHKGDLVNWIDGVDYVVGPKVVKAEYELTILPLHRKIDS